MIQYVMAAIEWAVVPIILFLLFVYSLFGVPDRSAERVVKASARAGAWAGLIVLVLFIISQKGQGLSFSFELPAYGFQFWTTVVSCAGGFIGSWGLDFIRRSRIVGMFVLVLVAASSVALFSYVFVLSVRQDLVFISLGVALGCLVHEVFFPSVGSTNESRRSRRVEET